MASKHRRVVVVVVVELRRGELERRRLVCQLLVVAGKAVLVGIGVCAALAGNVRVAARAAVAALALGQIVVDRVGHRVDVGSLTLAVERAHLLLWLL